MKTVENLLNAAGNKKLGNHRVEHGFNREFYYYYTAICIVNDQEKEFVINASYGTVSTTRACNAYRRQLEAQGYKEVEHVKVNV